LPHLPSQRLKAEEAVTTPCLLFFTARSRAPPASL
jgi:hypothetical protein